MVPHGVRLSLGSAGEPDPARVGHLAGLAERLGAPLVSEHVAFVRGGGLEAGHLLPVPRTPRLGTHPSRPGRCGLIADVGSISTRG